MAPVAGGVFAIDVDGMRSRRLKELNCGVVITLLAVTESPLPEMVKEVPLPSEPWLSMKNSAAMMLLSPVPASLIEADRGRRAGGVRGHADI